MDIRRYSIKQKIGSGGMATVYLAEDRILHRPVALKSLHPHLLSQPESVSRFSNEAHAIAQLDHENVIKIFDYGEFEGNRYLVMEYIDGVSMQQLIEDLGYLPNLFLLELICQILNGLSEVHRHQILHRDIKPANIMIGNDGRVRIMDFGIAYLVNRESITLTGSFVGSPFYLSPEQVTGGAVSEKSDIFSVGTLCYLAATGVHPFEADNPQAAIHRVINDTPAPPYTRHPTMLLWFSDMIERCLEKDPAGRLCASELRGQILQQCDCDGLQLGRSRVAACMEDRDAYRRAEKKEIADTYRKQAHAEAKVGNSTKAIRLLDQTARYGELEDVDTALIKRARRKKTVLIATAGLTLIMLAAGLISTVPSFSRETKVTHSVSEGRAAVARKEKTTEAPKTPVARPQNDAEKMNKIKRVKDIDHVVSDDDSETVESGVLNTEFEEDENRKTDSPPAVHNKGGAERKEQKKHSSDNMREKDGGKNMVASPGRNIVAPKDSLFASSQETNIITYGYVDIRTNPPWATLYIDKISRGQTPRVRFLPLAAGDHSLRIIKKGFVDHIDTINIRSEDTLQLRVRLKSDPAQVSEN